MNAAREHRVKSAFHEASLLSSDARRVLLLGLRHTDPDVAAEVESLLEHHDRTDAILDRTPADAALLAGIQGGADGALAGGSADSEHLPLPLQFGAYTLLRVLGEGGMGLVYEAEQASPRRRVALKLVRPEALSASVLRRFEHEIEALGMLDHPSIARVYEAGRAALQGHARAYIAMELVEGATLTEHAHRRSLRARQRIGLMVELCEALQFAHRRGVIHRDIKPGNILVGADGRPRVLDFGVARLTASEPGGATLTRAGQVVGTLGYMSPEQAGGKTAEVDTRTDVYSLGAVLYELLCRQAPIEVEGLSLHAALARIQTQEVRIPRLVRRQLGRDMEAVLLKALEKDPGRRYQHASELGADLRAYLRDEPVVARGPSRMYQFTKFCRRNRELVAAAAVVIGVALGAFGAIATALNRERAARADAVLSATAAEHARDEAVDQKTLAESNLKRYEAVAGFLRTLLAGVRPEIARGKDTTLLRQVLENAEKTLPDLESQPAAQADAMGMLAEVYRSLGDFEQAEHYGKRTIEQYTRAFGEEHKLTASAIHNLGALYRGSLRRYDEAEPLLQRATELFLAVSGPDNIDYRRSQNSLALLLMDTGKYAQAEPMLRQLREYEEKKEGPDAASTLRAMHNHAGALSMTGRVHEALALAQETYERRAQTLGEDHTDTVNSLHFVASTLRACGRAEESLAIAQRVLEIRSSHQGPKHQMTLSARGSIAQTLRDLGRLEEALAEASAVVADSIETLGAEHIDSIQQRLLVLECKVLLGRCDGLLEEAEAIFQSTLKQGARYAMWASIAGVHRGLALACVGDAAAESLLRTGYDELAANVGPANRLTRRAAESLAWYYRRTGDESTAAEWDGRAAVPPP
jgi:eukaryotic-like serine/threonine-protein kinase